jgi:hypothetical protein
MVNIFDMTSKRKEAIKTNDQKNIEGNLSAEIIEHMKVIYPDCKFSFYYILSNALKSRTLNEVKIVQEVESYINLDIDELLEMTTYPENEKGMLTNPNIPIAIYRCLQSRLSESSKTLS